MAKAEASMAAQLKRCRCQELAKENEGLRREQDGIYSDIYSLVFNVNIGVGQLWGVLAV